MAAEDRGAAVPAEAGDLQAVLPGGEEAGREGDHHRLQRVGVEAPLLEERAAPGAGQHSLPVTNTSSPVDLDVVNDILRLPYRQRLSIIVNEFGTALAGRGDDLNVAIHRANPALADTDKVLNVLAKQNHTLANLAVEADRVLTPLAGRRRQVADFITQANTTARATAQQAANTARSFQLLPSYLAQLQPTLTDLGQLSDEMTPVLIDLDRAAPDLARFVLELGPFSQAATPALKSLAKATDVGGPALVHSLPLLRRLNVFAEKAHPVANLLDQVTSSLNKTGGIERIMDYLFFQMLSVNGFDGVSHYLRAELLTNLCSQYAASTAPGCSANFRTTRTIGAASAAKNPFQAAAAKKPKAAKAAKAPAGPSAADIAKQRKAALDRIRSGVRNGSPAYGPSSQSDAILNYLLGTGG